MLGKLGWSALRGAVLALALVAGTAPAIEARPQSKVVYSHKAWKVRVVLLDGGDLWCVAQVSYPGRSFSIWSAPGRGVKLQFFDRDWSFDGSRATITTRVDRRPRWRLTNAKLSQSSIFFDLPRGRESARFVGEILRGNRLYLGTASGRIVSSYSLSGSRRSIDALSRCVDAI